MRDEFYSLFVSMFVFFGNIYVRAIPTIISRIKTRLSCEDI